MENESIEKTKRNVSRTKQPRLLFPAHLARRFLKHGKYSTRIGRNASVALAAVVEYLTLELLGLSGMIAVKLEASRIRPRHLLMSIRLDDELNELLSHITIPNGGVLPSI